MKKLLTLLLMLILPLALAACRNNELNPGDNNGIPTPEIPTDEKYETRKDYYYEFTSKELSDKGGSLSLNNLNWNYSQAEFIGYDSEKGIQIGSSKKPVANYVLTANFGENVKVSSLSLELGKGSGGDSKFTVSLGSFTKEETISDTKLKEYIINDINQVTNSLELTLSATAKAIYIKSIAISLLTKADSKLDFSGNSTDKPVEPEQPQGSEIKPGQGLIPKTNYTLTDNIVEEYYKLFDLTLKGDALRKELDTKNDLKTKLSYGDARYILQYTDEMLNKPGYVFGMYDGLAIKATWENGTTWNREHVWACNHMTFTGDRDVNNSTIDHKSDLHNLRASTNNVNSSRGDKYFSQLLSGADYYDPNSVATGGSDHRGDVARILFYMYAQYDFLFLNDNPNSNLDFSMGILSELLKWNEEDPVDKFEIRRNNRIYEYQGNRNPFIDHPSLAKQLFA